MNKFIKISLGLLISLFFLFITFRSFQFHSLYETVQHVQYKWILPGLGIYFVAYILRSLRWSLLLSPLEFVHPVLLLPIIFFGFFLNTILPARAGEFARAVTLSKNSNIPASSCLGSIAIERLTDLIGLLTLILLSSHLFPAGRLSPWKTITAVAIGFSIVGFLLFLFQKKGEELEKKYTGLLAKLIQLCRKLTRGFTALKSPVKMATVAMISILLWLTETSALMIISNAFQLNLTFLQSAAVIIGLAVGVMIPAAPGYVGTFEFFGQQILVMLGFPPDSSLAFIVVFHFFQMIFITIAGLLSFLALSLANRDKTLVPEPQTT